MSLKVVEKFGLNCFVSIIGCYYVSLSSDFGVLMRREMTVPKMCSQLLIEQQKVMCRFADSIAFRCGAGCVFAYLISRK